MNIYIKILVSIIILSGLLIRCRVNTDYQNQIYEFDLKELPKISEVKLSDLGLIDIEYMPLQTNEQCLIPMINDIIFAEDFFLIHFYTLVFMFRNDGKFVTKIGTEGRGPNEFTAVHDVDIERKSQNIYLVDGWQMKFFVFSKNGDFIKTIPTSNYSNISFQFTDSGILCYNTNSFANIDNSYQLIDTTGRIIKNFQNKYTRNLGQKSTTIFNENLFYKFNRKLYKKEIYSDTVYVFENHDFKPHFVILHGERLLTTEARSNYEHPILIEKFISQKNLFEFNDYVYYEFMYDFKRGRNNFLRGYIASKLDDTRLMINSDLGLVNDLDGGPNICPKIVKDNYTIISWIDASKLKTYIASEDFKNSKSKYPERKRELEELAYKLKETDNPVLMFVKSKK
jgi:hypothetical protein